MNDVYLCINYFYTFMWWRNVRKNKIIMYLIFKCPIQIIMFNSLQDTYFYFYFSYLQIFRFASTPITIIGAYRTTFKCSYKTVSRLCDSVCNTL